MDFCGSELGLSARPLLVISLAFRWEGVCREWLDAG